VAPASGHSDDRVVAGVGEQFGFDALHAERATMNPQW
jgi:hypothetical protein